MSIAFLHSDRSPYLRGTPSLRFAGSKRTAWLPVIQAPPPCNDGSAQVTSSTAVTGCTSKARGWAAPQLWVSAVHRSQKRRQARLWRGGWGDHWLTLERVLVEGKRQQIRSSIRVRNRIRARALVRSEAVKREA